MLAYRLLQARTQPEFQEVPDRHAGPGQVVVKVAGSGRTPYRLHRPQSRPSLLEGQSAALHARARDCGLGRRGGDRSDDVQAGGMPSRSTHLWSSCGRSHLCRSGEDNHCLYQKAIRAPGVGYDGGHGALHPRPRGEIPRSHRRSRFSSGRAAHGRRQHH